MDSYMIYIAVALIVAFITTVCIANPIINKLRKMKFGQKILEIGPKWHMNKQNIPTMGGIMFVIGIIIAMAISAIALIAVEGVSISTALDMLSGGATVLILALAYGVVGLVDDFAKIKKKQNAGLSAMQKLVLQLAVSTVFITLLRISGHVEPKIWIPFTDIYLAIPWVLYIVFAAFVIVGGDNAVNLTDGIDGLAASVTLPVAIFFMCVGIKGYDIGVIVFSAALAGSLVAFLIFNFNPAKVFMGDTGSLFLGGAVTGLAFACDMPLILVLIGLIYIWETLSVIIQVTYFKLTHGKRVFKMAPYHHHLEMCGWGEKKIVLVFTGITTLLCIIAFNAI